jgi:hypothetical protein
MMGAAEKVSNLDFKVSMETDSNGGLVWRVTLPPMDRVGIAVGYSGSPLEAGDRMYTMLSEVAEWAWNLALESVRG